MPVHRMGSSQRRPSPRKASGCSFFPCNAAAAASGLLRCQCQATAAPAALNAWLLRVTAATEHPCAGVPGCQLCRGGWSHHSGHDRAHPATVPDSPAQAIPAWLLVGIRLYPSLLAASGTARRCLRKRRAALWVCPRLLVPSSPQPFLSMQQFCDFSALCSSPSPCHQAALLPWVPKPTACVRGCQGWVWA